MKHDLSENAQKNYMALPKELRRLVDKQFEYLLWNHRHPSLNAKKYQKNPDIWQARVSKRFRFYFQIRGIHTTF